jgi:hypothetical protein
MVTKINFAALAERTHDQTWLIGVLAKYDTLLNEEILTSQYRSQTFSALVLKECYDIVNPVSTEDSYSLGVAYFCFNPLIRIHAVANVFTKIILTPVEYGSDAKEIPSIFLAQIAQLEDLKRRFSIR